MLHTRTVAKPAQHATTAYQSLHDLLSNSGDEFYGDLQRILNTVVQPPAISPTHEDPDKLVYSQRLHHHPYV